MPAPEDTFDLEGLQTALFFEAPEELYARVFRELRPRAPLPAPPSAGRVDSGR